MAGRMAVLSRRLGHLEAGRKIRAAAGFQVVWPDELVPCADHPRCEVEVATGIHHTGVLHLSFDAGDQRW
jgi:hypothetical protein